MTGVIDWLTGKSLFGWVIGKGPARIIAHIGLVLLILSAMGGLKCAYDANLIRNHDNARGAATAKADRKADAAAAETRRADDARIHTEATAIKEAIDEAHRNGADPRAAYYECVRRQQAARQRGEPPAGC